MAYDADHKEISLGLVVLLTGGEAKFPTNIRRDAQVDGQLPPATISPVLKEY